jgi:hypothetical protein
MKELFGGRRGPDLLQVYIPGESFDAYVNKECKFRLNHVPAGTFDLLVNGGRKSPNPIGVDGIVVKEGEVKDLGDIALCYDYDGDGSNQLNDCNDENPSVRPGAQEICEDQVDNDCDDSVDEGCPQPSPQPSPSPSPDPS